MIIHRKQTFNFDSLKKIDDSKKDVSMEEMVEILKDTIQMQQLYNAAIKEVSTKLDILDDEFQVKHSHNPIHHMESRLKHPESIVNKLSRRGLEISIKSAMENITDIAGIRVICYYIEDVYTIADLFIKQDDVNFIKEVDYIKNPKPNGYRSLHLVVAVPVFLAEKKKKVPVEIQIRTIAMDFWASLEHQLRYKTDSEIKEDLQQELMECADGIAEIDRKMQDIYNKINKQDQG